MCLLGPGGLVLDIDGAFGRLSSLPWPAAALGRRLHEVLPWAPPLPDAAPTTSLCDLEDGRVELVCRPSFAAPVAYVVTARRLANESALARQLRVARQTLDLVVEASPLAILTLDPHKRVAMWNRAAETIFGWTRDEILGERYPLVPVEELEAFEALFEKVVLRGEGFTGVDGVRRRKDGSEVEVRMHAAALRDGEFNTVGGMALLEDRTETRALEDRVRHSQKMEAVGRLAGGIAHDFNNLLTVVVGMADLLDLDSSLSEVARDRVAEILRVAGSARELVAQLMTFSRRQVVRPELLDLNDRVQDSAKMLRRVIGESVELELELCERRAWVRLDPSQFDQVLINLAVNAADAMERGGRLRYTTNIVDFDSESSGPRAGGRYVCLEVTDTGDGIPEAILPHIFDPFFTTKATGKGTGLGLANVYGIVHQAGGEIEVESSPGHGTCFRVLLPTVAPPPRRVRSGPHRAALVRGNERILLVEDNPAVRASTAKLLGALGYEVQTAEHGVEALELLDAGLEIDLLITDLSMPKMGGAELVRRLRPRRPGLPVLFMSGNLDVAELREQVEQGRVRFLQKPVTLRELAQATREVLEAPHRQTNHPPA